jgi:hypothetical protein
MAHPQEDDQAARTAASGYSNDVFRRLQTRVTLHPKDDQADRIIGLLHRNMSDHATAEGSAILVDDSAEVVHALHGIDPNWRNHLFCRVEPPRAA